MARVLASSIDRSTNASWGSPGTHLTPPRCRPTRRSPTAIPHRQRRRRRKPAAADETRTAGTSPVERRRITDAAMALARSDQDLTRLSPRRHLRADVYNHFLRTKAGAASIGPSLAPRNRIGTVVG